MRDGEITRVGIDIDTKDNKFLEKCWNKALDVAVCYHALVKLFSTRRGYHIHLCMPYGLTIEEDLCIRYAIGDSNGRLLMEEERLKIREKYGIFENTFDLMSMVKLDRHGRIGTEDLVLELQL